MQQEEVNNIILTHIYDINIIKLQIELVDIELVNITIYFIMFMISIRSFTRMNNSETILASALQLWSVSREK